MIKKYAKISLDDDEGLPFAGATIASVFSSTAQNQQLVTHQ